MGCNLGWTPWGWSGPRNGIFSKANGIERKVFFGGKMMRNSFLDDTAVASGKKKHDK
jgi:hypothetical protein